MMTDTAQIAPRTTAFMLASHTLPAFSAGAETFALTNPNSLRIRSVSKLTVERAYVGE